jgi:peptide/nickel transport system substrate-binding protein
MKKRSRKQGVWRKTLGAGLVLVLVLGLCGCGARQDQGSASDSTFRIAKTWDKTGIRNHYHGGSAIGGLEWLAVEPLVQYVRSTDELFYLLAESIEHLEDGTSLVHIRENAKWHNGDDFVADDVMAYYHINFVSVTNYLAKPMEKIDDKTVKLTWKSWMEPNDNVKTLLLAEQKTGSVQYKEFQRFVDKCQEILLSQPDCEEGYLGSAPFGKLISPEAEEEFLANYNDFKAYNPDWFVATGPYKLEKENQNQMILTKNEDYYFADNVKFDKVICYNVADTNAIYNMLSNGEIYYQDGMAPEATLNAILDSNPNMAHLKMFDPGAIGLVFNLEKEIWTPGVRQAFQYIFNREEMRNAGNKYAITSQFPLIGMAPSEAQTWLTPEDFEAIPRYSQDLDKAAQLLEAEGWVKKDGKWTIDGSPVKLSLGYDGTHPGMCGVAEAVESAMNDFGIEVSLKRANDWGSWFDTAKAAESVYDFVVNWTDLNMSFSYPTGSFQYVFNDINGPIMKLPKFTEEDYAAGRIQENQVGSLALEYQTRDGSGSFYVKDVLSNLYYYSDEELREVLADMIMGTANENLGVQFYQNVTGSFVDTSKIGGLPMEEYFTKERNVTYVPGAGTDEFYEVARTNLIYSQGISFSQGFYEPKN